MILSHGNSGSMGSHADTALALAETGYVAVAITRADDNDKNEGVSPSVRMVSRPDFEEVKGAGHFAFLAPCNPELES